MGEEQRDNHVQAHHLLHKRAHVGQLVVVSVGFADQVAFSENGVELISNARLYVGVVHELQDTPLDPPKCSFRACAISKKTSHF